VGDLEFRLMECEELVCHRTKIGCHFFNFWLRPNEIEVSFAALCA
jgi:hypothetical protein